jgi:hypothetical protein
MTTIEIIASLSAGAAIFSLILSIISLVISGKALTTNKNMFRRQGVIDLHMAWHGVNEIDTNKLIGPDVVRGVNALDLTASLWNHDVIEKTILYQSYWTPFKELYETLNSSTNIVPGNNKRCKDLLTKEITRAYEDMKKMDIGSVIQTKI